jgi:hypothetical protein
MKFLRAAAAGITAVGITALALAGCGHPAPSPATPSSSASAPGGAAPAAAPLPLDQRLVPGDLAGLTSPAGVKTANTPDAYVGLQSDPSDPDAAQQRAYDVARFTDKGFVAGAAKIYGDENSPGRGISAVVQLGSPAQATAYVQNLFQDEFGSDMPPTAVKGVIEGSEASNTITDKENQDGDNIVHGWVAFADGPFVYLVAADTDAPGVEPQTVIDAAKALFEKVKGAPPA